MIYEHSELSRRAAGPRIAAIGGGTGLSTMLRGLKKYTDRLQIDTVLGVGTTLTMRIDLH